MGFIDKYLLGKKKAAEDLPPPKSSEGSESDDALGSLEQAYGIAPIAPVSDPAIEPARPAANPGPHSTGGAAGEPVAGGRSAASESRPGPDQTAEPEGQAELLDADIRDLFTEHTTVMDPQLEALLARVENVDARDLADELRQFARSIGADSRRRPARG